MGQSEILEFQKEQRKIIEWIERKNIYIVKMSGNFLLRREVSGN